MKKGFKSLAAMMAIVTAAGALASCTDDYTYPDYYWEDGLVATVGGRDVTFEDIYDLFSDKKDSVTAYFDTASKLLAQFVTPRTDFIISSVDMKISDQEQTWKKNASSNNTSYKEEMQKTLDSEGVIDEDALRDKWIAEAQVSENNSNYTQDNFGTVTTIQGNTANDEDYLYYISEAETQKYIDTEHPYHVSHVLVKVDAASGGEGIYNGQISESNAIKIGNVVKSLTSASTFGNTALLFSDDGSASNYGDLFGGSTGYPMQTSTSYVNEFKLGLYAYDTFINPETKNRSEVKNGLRVPGTDTTDGSITSSTVANNIDNTSYGNGKAYGIPLSIAFELSEVSDQEKADTGFNTVSENRYSVTSSQYPRNVLFNNYFNNHAISFVYDDRADYAERFVNECLDFENNLTSDSMDSITKNRASAFVTAFKAASSTTAKLALIAACEDLNERYDDFLEMCASLGLNTTTGAIIADSTVIDSNKFASVDGVSNNLEAYVTTYTSSANGHKVSGETAITALDSKNILVDDNGDPIMITRAGSGSGDSGYQGIHFITVNNNPWGTGDEEKDALTNEGNYTYRYYRTNVPDNTQSSTAYTSDFSVNPSITNYVVGDLKNDKGNETTYTDRIQNVRDAIKAYDSNTNFKIWEANLAKFKEKYNKDFTELLGKTTDSAGKEVSVASLIDEYITYTRDSAVTSAEESLDSSWETYINSTVLNETLQPKRIIPTVCVSYFQSGVINAEEEAICHVKN